MENFSADYGEVKPKSGGGTHILPPKDEFGKRIKYLGEILAAEGYMSKSGNPSVKYSIRVHGGEFDGIELKYQNLTFLPKEHEMAGIALHYLKCLWQPHEGKFRVTPANWIGRLLYFFVKTEESATINPHTGSPYQNSKVSQVDALTIDDAIRLGVIDNESQAPTWLRETQLKPPAAKNGEKPSAIKPRKPAGPSPEAVCDCGVHFKDHAKSDHEFSEKMPF